jgi:glycosyltransferase involved in cell wall biosynthesis
MARRTSYTMMAAVRFMNEITNQHNMRVFHIAPYYPPHLGGLQQAVKNLATAQAKNGLSVTVITSNKPKKISLRSEPVDNVRLIKLRTIDIGHTPLMPQLLPVLLRKVKKDDIIHVHFAQFYVGEIVALFSKLTRHPFVLHYHGDVVATGPLGRLLPFYKAHILKAPLKQASAIIYPSEDFRNHILKKFPFLEGKKDFVVPNGIELPKIDRVKYPENNKFLTASRLSKVKNVSALVEAFVEAKKKAPTIELYIAGQGDEEAGLKGLVDNLGANSYIHFLGNLKQSELRKRYMNSSVFLVTAKWETFGMSIAEAMSYGLPVIAFNAPAVSELVRSDFNGLLIDKFDKHDFANGIIRLANSPKVRKRLSTNALKTVEAFECQKVAKGYENIYREIMSGTLKVEI